MRAKEIFEGKDSAHIPWGARETLPASMTVPDLDPYYEYYRFLISLAGYPTDVPKSSETRDIPMVIPYTPIEHAWALDVIQKHGKTPKHLSKSSSSEPKSVNKVSPVRVFKDYE